MESREAPALVHVGRSALEGSIARYANTFDLLEVAGERGRHPRRPGLLEWRRLVGPEFVFSVVVPASVSALEAGAKADELLAHARMVADALGAAWWLLKTPMTVTPSTRALRELEAVVASLRAEGRRIAWEPRGVWGDEGSLRAANQLGIHLVRDLAVEDPLGDSDVIYTRLRALGAGARIGAAAAERVAERLEEAAEACVIVEGTGGGRVRQVLREMLGAGAAAGSLHDDDDDDDEGEGEGEGEGDEAEYSDEDEGDIQGDEE